MPLLPPADRLRDLPTSSIWSEMTPLAVKHKAVNLGQGFPNFAPPAFLLEELQGVLAQTAEFPLAHQYGPLRGHPELVAVLTEDYTRRFGRPVTADNIIITNGVTQALHVIMQAYINEGDEVLLIEPYYDVYYCDVLECGGVVKSVALAPSAETAGGWALSADALRAAVTDRTRLLLINTPQNVPGKVWTREELEAIAAVVLERPQLAVVADEVYMHLTYDGPADDYGDEQQHVSLATLPGMAERTITVCSSGKTFNTTGWKVGWIVAPAELTQPITQAVCCETFCVATPLQIALARGMRAAAANGYYVRLRADFRARRALLESVIERCGLTPVRGAGGYFVMADISRVDEKHYYSPERAATHARDWQFCLWLTEVIGVCAIPTTAFCTLANVPQYERFVRFAFCKPEAEIEAAGERLLKLKEYFVDTS